MKKINIHQKLKEIDYPVQTISLGEFDWIGEFTAKKARHKDDELFRTAGCFFRPNYERGILIYYLIKRFEIKSVLEIGFGRGYASLCAAKAMSDMGWNDGKVFSIDPEVDEKHLQNISSVFPKEWFAKISLLKGTIDGALPELQKQKIVPELVYIDGDHRFDAVKNDWEKVKDIYTKFVLFDDYDFNVTNDIQVKMLVDQIELDKELIISDRRIFLDDRCILDSEIDYGQVLIKHPNFDDSVFLGEW